MGQEIGRAHFTDKLSVELPTAVIRKGFSLNKQILGLTDQDWCDDQVESRN